MFLSQVPVHAVTLDMRDLDAVAQLPGQLPEEFKAVDILVNNAGLALGVTTVDTHDIEVRIVCVVCARLAATVDCRAVGCVGFLQHSRSRTVPSLAASKTQSCAVHCPLPVPCAHRMPRRCLRRISCQLLRSPRLWYRA